MQKWYKLKCRYGVIIPKRDYILDKTDGPPTPLGWRMEAKRRDRQEGGDGGGRAGGEQEEMK